MRSLCWNYKLPQLQLSRPRAPLPRGTCVATRQAKRTAQYAWKPRLMTPYQPSLGIVPLIWAAMFDP